MSFNDSVLRNMTTEELLREPASMLLCNILIERMDKSLEEVSDREGLEGLLSEIEDLIKDASEDTKLESQDYRELIEALERLHELYS